MKHFKNYVCVFFGAIAFLFLSGCSGSGGGGFIYHPISENQIGIRFVPTNSISNWHDTPFEKRNIRTANLRMILFNEELFSPFNYWDGGFFGYPIYAGKYEGQVFFSLDRQFIPTVDINMPHYLGEVKVQTFGAWQMHDQKFNDEIIEIKSLNKTNAVFYPGKWYDVTFSFTEGPPAESAVDFHVDIEEKTNVTTKE